MKTIIMLINNATSQIMQPKYVDPNQSNAVV